MVLLILGVVLVNMLTPGKLGRQIWEERNHNAALLLSSALLDIGGIVFTSIWTSYHDFGKGLASTAASAYRNHLRRGPRYSSASLPSRSGTGRTRGVRTPPPARLRGRRPYPFHDGGLGPLSGRDLVSRRYPGARGNYTFQELS
ncbi:DUF350 domain-containing protein [Streptomyces sp. NBC_00234]|uniref:DUF350 domain-containing protein n=1 Tax=Streptomyces sp. NBC_00234 TaxID=2903638 RepID=UPI002E2D296D|nr:DUF350 domain-containing protein [Streptomyces sp. NBC_00234]